MTQQPPFPMEGIGEMLIRNAAVHADMLDQPKTTTSTISASALGPCVGLILDFVYLNSRHLLRKKCLLIHCSYSIDEENKTSQEILKEFLKLLVSQLKKHLQVDSLYSSVTREPIILNSKLIVAGGDTGEVRRTHATLALLNIINNNNNKIFLDEDADIHLLFKFFIEQHNNI
jgi:hypothetical protein